MIWRKFWALTTSCLTAKNIMDRYGDACRRPPRSVNISTYDLILWRDGFSARSISRKCVVYFLFLAFLYIYDCSFFKVFKYIIP